MKLKSFTLLVVLITGLMIIAKQAQPIEVHAKLKAEADSKKGEFYWQEHHPYILGPLVTTQNMRPIPGGYVKMELAPAVLSPGDEAKLIVTARMDPSIKGSGCPSHRSISKQNILALAQHPKNAFELIEAKPPYTEVLIGTDRRGKEVWFNYDEYKDLMSLYKPFDWIDKPIMVVTKDFIGIARSAINWYIWEYDYLFNREYEGDPIWKEPDYFKESSIEPAIIDVGDNFVKGFRVTYHIALAEDLNLNVPHYIYMHLSTCLVDFLKIPVRYKQFGSFNHLRILLDQEPSRGSISVRIEPESAIRAGAKWRIKESHDAEWKDSSDTLWDIVTGDYLIEYKDVPGYKGPPSQVVTITDSGPVLREEVYVEWPLKFYHSDYVRTTAATVKLRESPKIADNVLKKLPFHTVARIDQHPDNGSYSNGHRWYCLTLLKEDKKGWVSEKYLEKVTFNYAFPLFPSNAAENVSVNPTFKWQKVPWANKYGLYVSEYPYGPENLIFINEDLTDNYLKLPINLKEGSTYYWNMRVKDDEGWGPLSTSFYFTVGETLFSQKRIAYLKINPEGSRFKIMTATSDGAGQNQLLDIDINEDIETGLHGIAPPAWSPDGKKIAFSFADQEFMFIYLMNADGTGRVRRIKNKGMLYSSWPIWSPDSEKLAYIHGFRNTWSLYVIDADGNELTRMTKAGSIIPESIPSWSPDGEKIAFRLVSEQSSEDVWSIYIINADGKELTRLTGNTNHDVNPAWSPDGEKIAFKSRDRSLQRGSGVCVVNADGTDKNCFIDEDVYHVLDFEWSPDGEKIALSATASYTEKGIRSIYIMNADGTGMTRLTDDKKNNRYPIWSPDSQNISFISNCPSSRDSRSLEVINIDGTGRINLVDSISLDSTHSWSPDGEMIVYTSEHEDKHSNIYTINTDGTNLNRLTDDNAYYIGPTWEP